MTNDFKTAITQNLEKRIVTIGNTIVAISSQGYVVNSTKFYSLQNNLILHNLFKNIDSFDITRQNHLEVLYNTI